MNVITVKMEKLLLLMMCSIYSILCNAISFIVDTKFNFQSGIEMVEFVSRKNFKFEKNYFMTFSRFEI